MKSLRRVFGASFVFSVVGLGHLVIANPVGETVVGGAASFDRSRPGRLTINQATDRLIINWRDFSIGRGETTSFLQPSATSIAVNRVLAGNPSRIYGNLEANGIVYLINPNGILVGPSGAINTRTFVGSTLDAPDSSFMSGTKLTLSGNSDASVVNQGTIEAIGGDVFLVGRSVENLGTIRASAGTVGLGAGSEVMIVPSGNERLSVIAGGSSSAVGVNNQGTVEAVAAELKAAGGNIYALAINNGGIIRATGVRNQNGRVFLTSDGGNIENSGIISANNADGSGGSVKLDGGHNAVNPSTVISSGTIEARGNAEGTTGGGVQIAGDHVGLFGTAVVDVSGQSGGGRALIGGDYQGANSDVQNAQRAYVSKDATIRADAVVQGNGGRVIVWSDEVTRYYGSLSARGGALGGNGGFAEVSGKTSLEYRGVSDLRAPEGRTGSLLLDPKFIVISSAGTDPVAANDAFADNLSGTSTISPGDLVAALNTADVSLQANTDITISDAINASGNANVHDLALRAGRSILINAGITLRGSFAATFNDSGATVAQRDSGAAVFTMTSSTITAPGGITIQGGTLAADSSGATTIADNTGNIQIDSLNANAPIQTTATADGLTAGNISVVNNAAAGKSITVSGTLDSRGSAGGNTGNNDGGNGGSVTVTASGALIVAGINTAGGNGHDGGGPNGRSGGNAGDITLTGGTGISLTGDITAHGGTGIPNGDDGNLNLTATAGGVTQSGGVVDLGSAGNAASLASLGQLVLAGAGSFVLDRSGNDLPKVAANVAGSVTLVTSGDLTVVAAGVDANAGSVSLTAGAATTDRVITLDGDVHGDGGVTLTADNMVINAGTSVDAGTGVALFRPFESGTLIVLAGADAAGTLGISANEFGRITAGTVTIGNSTAGNITVSGDVNVGAQDINLVTGGNITINDGDTLTTTGDASLTAAGSIVGVAGATAQIEADGLTLLTTGTGDIGSSASSPFVVDANSVTATTAGAAGNDIFLREKNGLTGLALNAGLGNVTLVLDAGAIADTDGTVDITAAVADVTLSGAFGASGAGNAIQTSVDSLSVASGNGSQFITEANGLTALNLSAGSGDITLTLTAGTITDSDVGADITAANATVTAAAFGASGAGNAINTSVGGLSVDTSAGNGSQFITEANGLTGLNLNAGSGNVNLVLTAGSVADTDVGTDITAGSATVTAAAFGASGAGNAINTSVNSLSVNTSTGNGSQFITEANGLTAIDLNAGSGNITLTLTAGAIADTDASADITADAATVVASAFGATGNSISTSVNSLSVNTSAGGGSQFITEANGLTALNLNAGAGDVNLTLTLGGLTDADGSADITAVNASVTLSDVTAQNVGTLADHINTSVNSLDVDTSTGGGSQFITEASGLTALNLNAGAGDVDLTLTLGSLTDNDLATDITANDATLVLQDLAPQLVGVFFAIHTSVDGLTVDTSAGGGSARLVEANGLTSLDLNLGAGSGNLTLTAGSLLDTDANTDVTSAGDVFLTVSGAGNSIGSAANPISIGGSGGTANLSAADGGVHVYANAAGGNDITFTSSTLNAGDITTEFSQPGKTYTVTYDNGTAGDLTVRGNGNIPTPVGVTVLAPGTLTLNAAGQIGGGIGSPLHIRAGILSASSAGGNSISILDEAGGLKLGLVDAGVGAVNLTAQGGDLTSANVDGTADLVGGAVNLTVTGGNSTIGESAANRLEINATTSLTADTAGGAGDGIFVQDTAGGLAVASVDAGVGDVNLNVVNGSLTSAVVDGNADIIGGNVTLAVSGAGNDIGASGVSPLEISADTLRAATAGAAGDNIFVLDTAGGLFADSITAGAGNVTLSVLNGSLTSATVDGAADIVGDTVNLMVSGIGVIGSSPASRLEVDAKTLRAATANKDIHIVDTTGGVEVDLVDAGSANVNLNALNGSITSASVNGTPDIIGATVNLAVTGAGSDIGENAANRLEINAATLNASTAGAVGDDIFVLDTAGGLTAGLITAGAGDVNLRVAGGSLISGSVDNVADIVGRTVTLAVTGAGSDIGSNPNRLETDAVTLNASTDGAAGDNIFVFDTAGGVAAGSINAGAGDVNLLVRGGNLTSAIVDGSADVIGANVALTLESAAGRVGSSAVSRLEINATVLDVHTAGDAAADVSIVDTAGGVAIGGIDAIDGDVNLRAEGGNITSLIVDGNADIFGAALNLTTTGGGSIGISAAQPLEIDGASLAANAGGSVFVADTSRGLTLNDIVSGGAIDVDVRSAVATIPAPLTVAGDIDAATSVFLTADGAVSLQGDITAGTGIEVSTPSGLALSGNLDAGTSVDITASGAVSIQGDITAGTEVEVLTGSDLSLGGAIDAGAGVLARAIGRLRLGGSIEAGAGNDIVLVAETLGAPVVNNGITLDVSGGGRWFIYSSSPSFNTPPILSVEGEDDLFFGSLRVDHVTFEKNFAANPPGDFPAAVGDNVGNMVFALPDGGDDFDEIAKFFADFIPVEDYRAVTISFGDYDPTKFGEVGDLWLSSSELYEEERKAGRAPRVAPEKIERMKFLIRGK